MCTSRKVRSVSIHCFVSMLVFIFMNFSRHFFYSDCLSFESSIAKSKYTFPDVCVSGPSHSSLLKWARGKWCYREASFLYHCKRAHRSCTWFVFIDFGVFRHIICLIDPWSSHFSWFFNNHIDFSSYIVPSVRRKANRLHGPHGFHSVVDSGRASKILILKHLNSLSTPS